MQEFEIVEHPQIDGLRVFFDTVHYRTPHIHRELELILLMEGDLDVRIEHTRLLAHPGETVVFNPGQLHEFHAEEHSCTFLCLQVSPALAEPVYPAFGQLRFAQAMPGLALATESYRTLTQRLFRLTQSYLERPDGYELACAGQAFLLLGQLVEGVPHQVLSGSEVAGQQRRNDRLLRLIRYVDENYMHKVNLSDFARQEGLSLGYLSHFAREVLGRSFQDYVNTVRFYAACKLIASGQYRMVDVYAASGFSDYRYFSRAFQKRFGVTPEEYRRRSQFPVLDETHVHHSVHSLERFYTRGKSLELLRQYEPRFQLPQRGS